MPAIRGGMGQVGLDISEGFLHPIYVKGKEEGNLSMARAALHDGTYMYLKGKRLKNPKLQEVGSLWCELAIKAMKPRHQPGWVNLN